MSEKNQQQKQPKHPSTTIFFVRHGENKWTKKHKLAGRTPGVFLNKQGRKQAKALGKRLANTKLDAIYASPLERTIETAQAIVQHHPELEVIANSGLLEVDYGDWTGAEIKKLAEHETWPVVQRYPSGAGFPGGETMYAMQARFIQEIYRLVDKHPNQTLAVVGHADLIKSAIAHCLGVHFDLFQRITISTASISGVTFSFLGPRLLFVNDTSHNPAPKKEKGDK